MKMDTVATEFVERLGVLFEGEGLPRIAGRILGFLLVQGGGPCDFEDIRNDLQIAHGSVSTNTRLLENLGVVERVTFPGDRRTHFQLTDDPYARLLQGYIERTEKIRQTVADTRRKLPKKMNAGDKRLREFERFYEIMTKQLKVALETWHKTT